MSVLIKGMKMPTTCRKCKLKMNCDNCEGWECYCLPLGKNIGYMDDEPDIPSEKRRNDCPLVPVPPHGDLIDRDALTDAIERTDWYHQAPNKNMVHGANSAEHQAWYKEQDVYAAVDNSPTIIPAEEEDG